MEDNFEENESQGIDPNYVKYAEIYSKFKNEMTYEQRLDWWRENDIDSLTVVLFPKTKTAIEHHATMRTVHQFSEQGETVKSLSIEPFNEQQLEQFEQWALEESIKTGSFTSRCLSKNLVKDYWIKVGISPMPKEVLAEEIRQIDAVVTDAESYPDRTEAILFLHSFRRRKLGYSPFFDYEELYISLFSNDRRDRTVNDLSGAEQLIPNLYKGLAYCEYRGFLQKQQERLVRGDNISKPEESGDESNQEDENQEALVKKIRHKEQIIIAYYLIKHELIKIVEPTKEIKFGIINALFMRGLSHSNTKRFYNSIDNPSDPYGVKTIKNLESTLPYFEQLNIEDIVKEIKEEIARLKQRKG